ncbi:conserved hypothetical protein [Capnocytophaga canimorsus]|nr:conserved hypothetical protein [Capnocytophaga canimorsus]
MLAHSLFVIPVGAFVHYRYRLTPFFTIIPFLGGEMEWISMAKFHSIFNQKGTLFYHR